MKINKIILTLVFLLGVGFYFNNFVFAENNKYQQHFEKPDLSKWNKLRAHMTKEEVRSILGEPMDRIKGSE